MKKRIYTQGMTIFTSPEMYYQIRDLSDDMNISLSELMRNLISNHLKTLSEDKMEGEGVING